MTYIPPERDDGGDQLDQTQKLTPGVLPSVGNGVDEGGQPSPFEPAVPFAADRGGAEPLPPPVEPKPPRDRIVFQLVWEAILVLLTANALFLVYQQRDEIFGGASPMDAASSELRSLAPLLLLVTALGLSLRLGAVNLSIPAVAYLVLAVPSLFVGDDPWIGLGMTAAAAAAVTVLFVLLVLVLRLPAWMAGLACLFAVAASIPVLQRLAAELGLDSVSGWSAPTACGCSAARPSSRSPGTARTAPGVRDRFSRVKGAVEGTERRDAASVFALIGGTFLSVLLAGAAGFLPAAFGTGEATSQSVLVGMFTFSTASMVVLSPFVLIAVLLGGTSLWGRRGGVAGAVLATVTLWAVMQVWGNLVPPASDPDLFSRWTGALFAAMLLAGLVVSFGLDRLGRPKERPTEPESTAEMPGEPIPFTPGPEPGGLFAPDGGSDQNGTQHLAPRT
ncbi:hypothetical protein GCM10029992_06140 [Glycomyces albus]